MTNINKLYKTQIDSDDYTIDIDKYTVVTAKLIDFNNNPVSNTNVTITCDKGKFYNNSHIVQQTLIYTEYDDKIIFSFNEYSPKQTLKVTVKYNESTVELNIDLSMGMNGNNYTLVINPDSIEIIKIDLTPIVDNGVFYIGLDDKIWGGSTDLDELNIGKSNIITGTTNDEGYVKFVYKASEWGFITISANNTTVKLWVTGWRNIETRKNIEYTYNTQNCTKQFSSDPFPTRNIRYDDSIGAVQYELHYQNTSQLDLNPSDTDVLCEFVEGTDYNESKLPNSIFNWNFAEHQYNVWYKSNICFWFRTTGELCVRGYRENNSTHVVSIPANSTSIWLTHEKRYMPNGRVDI